MRVGLYRAYVLAFQADETAERTVQFVRAGRPRADLMPMTPTRSFHFRLGLELVEADP